MPAAAWELKGLSSYFKDLQEDLQSLQRHSKEFQGVNEGYSCT